MDNNCQQIWLEISNVRIEGAGKVKSVSVQLKGDKADREPMWWPVALDGLGPEDVYRNIAEAIDKKRTVLAALQPTGLESPPADSILEVRLVRIQLADSSTR